MKSSHEFCSKAARLEPKQNSETIFLCYHDIPFPCKHGNECKFMDLLNGFSRVSEALKCLIESWKSYKKRARKKRNRKKAQI